MTSRNSVIEHRPNARIRVPSGFGRFTAVFTEHQHLGTTMNELRSLARQLCEGSEPTTDPMRVLLDWQQDLARHFSSEEGEYFAVLAAERPDLIPRIAELRADHTGMLEGLAALLASQEGRPDGQEIGLRILALVDRLSAHERSETELIQDFFDEA